MPEDIYTDMKDGDLLRQANKRRLAELEADTEGRQHRIMVAARLRAAQDRLKASTDPLPPV